MPAGNGTGRKDGRGRNRGNRAGAGPAGQCVCPSCGETQSHRRGVPCFEVKCPKCGTGMVRR